MVTAPIVYVGHPFVISFLCKRLWVPTRSRDEIRGPIEPIEKKFFWKAQKAAEQLHMQSMQQHRQHQVPPHIPQHHQYTDFEMG
ncbi:hypothetical protein A2U01_0073487, partial [Trifolium medium]|nr:hypothetical protein [Trifolium medium]